jgi:hypothetical protein
MDKTQSLSQSILQSNVPPLTSDTITYNTSNTNESGFFSSIMSVNSTTWIIIILILAFLGLNIFVYLAKGTQEITDLFGPLFQSIFGTAAKVTGQTVDVSAEGAKSVVSGAAGTVNSGLTAVQQQVAPSTNKGQSIEQKQNKLDIMEKSSLNQALNSAGAHPEDVEADLANSSIQGGGKAGWCYIGDDRGFRSCAQVGVNDTCMSGEIFPTHDICMNPGLRQ